MSTSTITPERRAEHERVVKEALNEAGIEPVAIEPDETRASGWPYFRLIDAEGRQWWAGVSKHNATVAIVVCRDTRGEGPDVRVENVAGGLL
jgi:hypothetical protein